MSHENPKLAYSIKESSALLGVGVTKLYAEIKTGNIRACKFGKRTLITAEALAEWLNALPAIGKDVQ
jgi:excisionase family DNA binding protein